MHDQPIFYAPDIAHQNTLPEEEAGHALRVLRLGSGAPIRVADGRGSMWEATLGITDKRSCPVILGKRSQWRPYWEGRITLCLTPTKSIDRMEWLLEKAVEVGVDRILLLKSKHSERKHVNIERLTKIMISAMKQSQKGVLPELASEINLAQALLLTEGEQRLLCHCREADHDGIIPRVLPHEAYQRGCDVSLFIGPEGDFTTEEIITAQKAGARGISLGASRLRTETAALVALQWVHTLQMTAK